jgi:hypothetical protein
LNTAAEAAFVPSAGADNHVSEREYELHAKQEIKGTGRLNRRVKSAPSTAISAANNNPGSIPE